MLQGGEAQLFWKKNKFAQANVQSWRSHCVKGVASKPPEQKMRRQTARENGTCETEEAHQKTGH